MAGSIRDLLAPRSVAVIGVSSKDDSLSGRLLGNLQAAGFAGPVYPINPRVTTVKGLRCYPSLGAIGAPVDLAVVMVPRNAVLATVEECVAAAAKGVVVITAGFREGGEGGAALEREVAARLRAAGIRMIGPNCMGLINTDPAVRLDASFTPAAARPGAVAFGSHSGALGVAMLEAARDAGLGFSQFVSLGNCADVNVCDLLEAWEHDPGTRTIMLYLEGIDEPARFRELAGRITRRTPIIAFKGGRSAAGQRAASSHTGALAAADTAVDALLRQCGVVRTETLEELFALAVACERAPLPRGRRVAIVTNAGGPAIATCDALLRAGLTLAELRPDVQQQLRSFLPAEAAVGNPVDMLPSATPDNFARALELVAGDDGVDAVVVIVVTPIMVGPLDIAAGVASTAPGCGKTVLTVFMTHSTFFPESLGIAGLPPSFRYPEAAIGALGGMVRCAEAERRPRDGAPATPAVTVPRREGFLAPAEAFTLLAEAGIEVAPWRVASRREEVLAAGAELGFPVALKAFGAALVHKSELGAVAVGLESAAALAAALDAMADGLRRAGVVPEGYLVQTMVAGGREMIIGVIRDPTVGPLVMCGTGGVAVEAWKDVSFRVAPVTRAEAAAMVDELKGAALLGPFRGRPPADRGALEQAIVTLAAVAAAHGEIAECDVNPVLVLPEGKGCVAVDVRVRVAR